MPSNPRYSVTYAIGSRSHEFCIPAPNAAHVWRSWDRPGATLKSVTEVDRNNIEVSYQ